MFRRLTALAALLSVHLLVGCSRREAQPTVAPARAPSDETSGIYGVCTESGARHREPEPYHFPLPDASIFVKAPDGDEVLFQGKSDAQGRYRVEMKPGRYRVTARRGYATSVPPEGVLVDVEPGKFARVDIDVSTGKD